MSFNLRKPKRATRQRRIEELIVLRRRPTVHSTKDGEISFVDASTYKAVRFDNKNIPRLWKYGDAGKLPLWISVSY